MSYPPPAPFGSPDAPFGSGAQPPVPGVGGLPPAMNLPPAGSQGFAQPPGGFPPPGGGGFAPPPSAPRRRGSGLGLIGGYLGFRLLMWVIGMVISLGITAAVLFFGFNGNDVATRGYTPRDRPSATTPVTVPASWPAALAPPAGAEITGTTTTGAGTSAEQTVLRYSVAGDVATQVEALREQVRAAGYMLVSEAPVTGNTGSVVADGPDRQAVVSVTGSYSEPGTVDVNFALRAKA